MEPYERQSPDMWFELGAGINYNWVFIVSLIVLCIIVAIVAKQIRLADSKPEVLIRLTIFSAITILCWYGSNIVIWFIPSYLVSVCSVLFSLKST
jgi:hypothetical protein